MNKIDSTNLNSMSVKDLNVMQKRLKRQKTLNYATSAVQGTAALLFTGGVSGTQTNIIAAGCMGIAALLSFVVGARCGIAQKLVKNVQKLKLMA